MGKPFSAHAVAAEELVAEMRASILGAHLGLKPDRLSDHASCVGLWMKLLKDEKRAFLAAAAQPQTAVDWLLDKAGARAGCGSPQDNEADGATCSVGGAVSAHSDSRRHKARRRPPHDRPAGGRPYPWPSCSQLGRNRSGPVAELQRIDADEPLEAFAENGPLGYWERLGPPGQGQGVEPMRFAGVMGDERIVTIMTDEIGQAHNGMVAGFVGMGRGHRTIMKMTIA